MNPPAPVRRATSSEKAGKAISKAATKIARTVSANRELALAVFFLVLGFVMGRL